MAPETVNDLRSFFDCELFAFWQSVGPQLGVARLDPSNFASVVMQDLWQ